MSSSQHATSSARSGTAHSPARSWRWSVSDIVVASVLAVASGVIFWGWNLSYHLIGNLFVFYPPVETLVHGMWLFPAVLGALVIRKPGAAIYCEMVAAAVSALLGSQWGLTVLSSGFMQGLGAELIFLAVAYRRFSLEFAMLAGAASGLTGGITYHWIVPMYAYAPVETAIHISCFALSGAIIAGIIPWLATRGLAAASVLGPLASRRAHREPRLSLGRSRG
ncbi:MULTISPECIES: ECF transporter S component [Nesterenkonia]|uniref:Energy-coupling factor transport system substrate-specific component n=2 Tax=Nesterenkonia TaxID=57494 RepID=A0A839FP94_9MICC|nr:MULTISPECIES: ECF transporter S component [Nesterenkonia]MBA8921766.1 energy-coupling factor transport system substrate-specific component [Nesterenkonia jeotgali]NYJ16672.1 energy-coupling factor transport system substrate-specific component [Nesterenkonia sandarakina]